MDSILCCRFQNSGSIMAFDVLHWPYTAKPMCLQKACIRARHTFGVRIRLAWFAPVVFLLLLQTFSPWKTFRCQSPRLISPHQWSICVTATYCVHIFCRSFCLSPSMCTLEFVSVDQVNDANGFFLPSFPLFAVRILRCKYIMTSVSRNSIHL